MYRPERAQDVLLVVTIYPTVRIMLLYRRKVDSESNRLDYGIRVSHGWRVSSAKGCWTMTSASVMARNLSTRPLLNDLKSASVVRALQNGTTRRKLRRPLMDIIALLGNVGSKFRKVYRSIDGQSISTVLISASRHGGNVRGKHLRVSISSKQKTFLRYTKTMPSEYLATYQSIPCMRIRPVTYTLRQVLNNGSNSRVSLSLNLPGIQAPERDLHGSGEEEVEGLGLGFRSRFSLRCLVWHL